MKTCLNITVYQNDVCRQKNKPAFQRSVWVEDDVHFLYHSLVETLRFLYGKLSIVVIENGNVD